MSAFDKAQNVEQRSMEILRPFIQQRAYNGQYVVTSKGPLSRALQKSVGDMLYNTDKETIYSAEVKAEESNRHGNFFLETWSNRSRYTVGWMFTLRTDMLLYHFIDADELYVIPFERLRKWAFHDCKIYRFEEKRQSKYEQLNDTWGRCVPVEILTRDLRITCYRPVAEASF